MNSWSEPELEQTNIIATNTIKLLHEKCEKISSEEERENVYKEMFRNAIIAKRDKDKETLNYYKKMMCYFKNKFTKKQFKKIQSLSF